MSIGRLVDVHCDACGKYLRPFATVKAARAHARMFGWKRIPPRRVESADGGITVTRAFDLCPTCYARRPS